MPSERGSVRCSTGFAEFDFVVVQDKAAKQVARS
jgi:hypothetical protein